MHGWEWCCVWEWMDVRECIWCIYEIKMLHLAFILQYDMYYIYSCYSARKFVLRRFSPKLTCSCLRRDQLFISYCKQYCWKSVATFCPYLPSRQITMHHNITFESLALYLVKIQYSDKNWHYMYFRPIVNVLFRYMYLQQSNITGPRFINSGLLLCKTTGVWRFINKQKNIIYVALPSVYCPMPHYI